jgi:hypothetical protein
MHIRKKHHRKEKSYRLYAVANGLRMSCENLVGLLKSKGRKFNFNYDQFLSAEEISYIKGLYVQSTRVGFKKFLSGRLDTAKSQRIGDYYYNLTIYSNSPWNRDVEPAYWHLEDDKIEDEFFWLLNRATRERSSFPSIYVSIVRRIIRTVNIASGFAKSAIVSIIPPNLFFTYIDEEDSYNVATYKPGFAAAGT